MSEGGYLLWKRQKLRIPPTANYSDIKKPLCLPPGKTWCRDVQTNEWKVVDLVQVPSNDWQQEEAIISSRRNSSSRSDDDTNIASILTTSSSSITNTTSGITCSTCTPVAAADVVGIEPETTADIHSEKNIPIAHAICSLPSLLEQQEHHPSSFLVASSSSFSPHNAPHQDGTDDKDKQQEEQVLDGAAIKQDHGNDSVTELYHVVQPTDTLQGICLRYRITPTELRQGNMFSGSNLALAPSKLLIPTTSSSSNKTLGSTMHTSPTRRTKNHHHHHPTTTTTTTGVHHEQRLLNHTLQEKQHKIQLVCSTLGKKLCKIGKQEAVAYLDMNQWNVHEAIHDALHDWKWEQTKSQE